MERPPSVSESSLLMSASNAGRLWDLRVQVREGLLVFLRERYPQSLPKARTELSRAPRVEAPQPAAA